VIGAEEVAEARQVNFRSDFRNAIEPGVDSNRWRQGISSSFDFGSWHRWRDLGSFAAAVIWRLCLAWNALVTVSVVEDMVRRRVRIDCIRFDHRSSWSAPKSRTGARMEDGIAAAARHVSHAFVLIRNGGRVVVVVLRH